MRSLFQEVNGKTVIGFALVKIFVSTLDKSVLDCGEVRDQDMSREESGAVCGNLAGRMRRSTEESVPRGKETLKQILG